MMEMLTAHEGTIRMSVFVSVLIFMAILEAVFPRRSRVQKRPSRWRTNLGLIVIDTLVLRIATPLLAMSIAVMTADRGWGVFNLVELPVWLEIVFAIILLDMLIYWQHVAFHHIPFLWRFHKVHHADRDIDVTTGIRFHPIEIIISMSYKIVCILLIGPAVVAVFLFEILLNACAMFNHANVKLPLWFDRYIRAVLVTPDMHRVHHSTIVKETNSNFGFSLSWWDRLFGSYLGQPRDGHDKMTIGLSEYQDDAPARFFWALAEPFRSKEKS